MKSGGILAVVMTVCILVCGIAEAASEWAIPGSRAMSMGGAGVARPIGPSAVYWNPAALAGAAGGGINLAIGASFRDAGLGGPLSDIVALDLPTTIDKIEQDAAAAAGDLDVQQDVAAFDRILRSLDPSDAFIIVPQGGLVMNFGSIGAGAILGGGLGVSTKVDLVNLTETTLPNNTSEVNIRGLAFLEIPIAYGRAIDLGGHAVNLGGALKIVSAAAYDATVNMSSFEGEDVQDELSEYETETSFTVDLGAQYLCLDDALAVGLVLKNLTAPEFETTAGAKMKLDMQARAGVAYSLNSRLNVAADLDLTESESVIDGYGTRNLGAGISLDVTEGGGISVRGGVQKNLADSDSSAAFTLGASLGTKHVTADAAVVLSSDPLDFEDFTLPVEGLMFSTKVSW